MSSILQQARDAAYQEGRKSGEDWGRQLSQCSWDDGHDKGRSDAEKNYPNRARLFLYGFAFGVVCALCLVWYIAR